MAWAGCHTPLVSSRPMNIPPPPKVDYQVFTETYSESFPGPDAAAKQVAILLKMDDWVMVDFHVLSREVFEQRSAKLLERISEASSFAVELETMPDDRIAAYRRAK